MNFCVSVGNPPFVEARRCSGYGVGLPNGQPEDRTLPNGQSEDQGLPNGQWEDRRVSGLRLDWYLHCYVVSLDKKLYSTLTLFTQVYKWLPATYCWG